MFGKRIAIQAGEMKISDPVEYMTALHPQSSPAKDEDSLIGSIPLILYAVVVVGAIGVATARICQFFEVKSGFMPQLLTGVAAVALIIHWHLAAQRKLMREVSTALIAAAYYTERLEQFSVVDPHTELFNRRYLDQLFNQQLRWINRTGNPATVLLIDVTSDGQKTASEHVIVEAARLLRSNFRGSDYVIRNSNHQLLVLLPETTEEQAQFALIRLADKVDRWNLESKGSEMMLRHELQVCSPGGDLWEMLRTLEEKLCWSASTAMMAVPQ